MEKNAKIYFLIFISTAVLMASVMILTAYILDPFQIFHESFFIKNRYIKNMERFSAAGIIEREIKREECCDAVIIGTSHSQNFKAGDNVLQLSLPGALPLEQQALYKKVSESGEVKTITWDVHYTYAEDEIISLNSADKFFPAYLYDHEKWNDFLALVSIDMFLNFPKLFGGAKPLENYFSWYEDAKDQFGKSEALSLTNTKFQKKSTPDSFTEYSFPNIDNVLIPMIKNNPDQQFNLFLPPYSRHFYAVMQQEEFNRLMAMRFYLTQTLKDLPNAQLFAFDKNFESVNDLNDYRDFEHYSQDTSQRIADNIATQAGILRSPYARYDIHGLTQNVNVYIEQFESEARTE